ncbi:MAG: hypothetical protein ACXADH_16840 [Candidatus Kariarchaeaceae archaeon]|jgi:hypothetical protein
MGTRKRKDIVDRIMEEISNEFDWIKSEGHGVPSESDVLNMPIQSTVGDYVRQYPNTFFTFFTDGPGIFEVLVEQGEIEFLTHENIVEYGYYLTSYPHSNAQWTSVLDFLNEFPAVKELEKIDPILYKTMKTKFPFITHAYVGDI